MKDSQVGWLLLLVLATAACSSFQVEAGFKQPAELTATAIAETVRPTPTPKPQLGKLAFIRGGDVWVKELPNGEERRLTQDGRNSRPRWSPSGEWLAFQKEDRTAWVMRVSGTDAHQMETASNLWSPVADQMLYTSVDGLYLVDADGAGRRELLVSGRAPGAPRAASPVWSPDGQWIAFESTELEPGTGSPNNPPKLTAQTVYRIKADGTSLTEVYRNPDPSKPFRLVDWSPDGRYLLAWQDDYFPSASAAADGWPLFALPLAGGAPVKISERVLRARDFLSWAPAGHDLALVDGGDRSTWHGKHLAVSDLSGLAQLRSDPSRADLFPAWSPDGRSIAYTSAPAVATYGGDEGKRAAAQRKIWLMNPDGSGKRRLTSDPNYRDERPQWSRDGAFILFDRFQDEQMQLWLMRSDGSGLVQVVDELTPSPGWFGYYGYVGGGGLYDWWQGPPAHPRDSAATVGPKAGPSSTPIATAAPAPGPTVGSTAVGGGPSAFLQSAAPYLGSNEAQGRPESTLSARLQELAESTGLSLTYLKRSEGEPEAWVGAGPQVGSLLPWRQGEAFAYQTWRPGTGQGFSLYLAHRPVALRLVERDGSLEIGVIPANFGSTPDAAFVLARLRNGQWIRGVA